MAAIGVITPAEGIALYMQMSVQANIVFTMTPMTASLNMRLSTQGRVNFGTTALTATLGMRLSTRATLQPPFYVLGTLNMSLAMSAGLLNPLANPVYSYALGYGVNATTPLPYGFATEIAFSGVATSSFSLTIDYGSIVAPPGFIVNVGFLGTAVEMWEYSNDGTTWTSIALTTASDPFLVQSTYLNVVRSFNNPTPTPARYWRYSLRSTGSGTVQTGFKWVNTAGYNPLLGSGGSSNGSGGSSICSPRDRHTINCNSRNYVWKFLKTLSQTFDASSLFTFDNVNAARVWSPYPTCFAGYEAAFAWLQPHNDYNINTKIAPTTMSISILPDDLPNKVYYTLVDVVIDINWDGTVATHSGQRRVSDAAYVDLGTVTSAANELVRYRSGVGLVPPILLDNSSGQPTDAVGECFRLNLDYEFYRAAPPANIGPLIEDQRSTFTPSVVDPNPNCYGTVKSEVLKTTLTGAIGTYRYNVWTYECINCPNCSGCAGPIQSPGQITVCLSTSNDVPGHKGGYWEIRQGATLVASTDNPNGWIVISPSPCTATVYIPCIKGTGNKQYDLTIWKGFADARTVTGCITVTLNPNCVGDIPPPPPPIDPYPNGVNFSVDNRNGVLNVAWVSPPSGASSISVGMIKTSFHSDPTANIGSGATGWVTQTVETADSRGVGMLYLANGTLWLAFQQDGTNYARRHLMQGAGNWENKNSADLSEFAAGGRGQESAFRITAGSTITMTQARDNRGDTWTSSATVVTGAKGSNAGGVFINNGYGVAYTRFSDGKIVFIFSQNPENWASATSTVVNVIGKSLSICRTPLGRLVLLYQPMANGQVRCIVSDDRGATWHDDNPVGTITTHLSRLVCERGVLYCVYLNADAPKFVASQDGGISWS